MLEHWVKEKSCHERTIDWIRNWNPDPFGLIAKLPDIPLEYNPSQEGSVAIQLTIFATQGCVVPTKQVSLEFLKLWDDNLLTGASLLVRLVYELWGAISYANSILKKMQCNKNVELSKKISQQLLTGSRSPVLLPWGGYSDDKSIHIMDMIRALSDIYPNAIETYEFLCESCHPSCLMLGYWTLAIPPGNWDNTHFQENMHLVITRTLNTLRLSLEGISSEFTELFNCALPIIEKDRKV